MANLQTDECTCGHLRAAHFEANTQGCMCGDCICESFDKVDPLRAAAPELLEALKAIVASAKNGNEPGQTWVMIAGGLVDRAETAIHKAEGR